MVILSKHGKDAGSAPGPALAGRDHCGVGEGQGVGQSPSWRLPRFSDVLTLQEMPIGFTGLSKTSTHELQPWPRTAAKGSPVERDRRLGPAQAAVRGFGHQGRGFLLTVPPPQTTL